MKFFYDNVIQAYHAIVGLYSLAVKHYERVLEFATALEKDPDSQVCHFCSVQVDLLTRILIGIQHVGVAREAAYNLSMIYVSTGATPLAEALYRRWLSI